LCQELRQFGARAMRRIREADGIEAGFERPVAYRRLVGGA
jgi:hypothetical protein